MTTSDTHATTVVTLPSLDGLVSVSDARLLELEAEVTSARRRVDAAKVAIVAELVRRSDPALGHNGLAARLGAPTPEKAIQSLGGVSRGEARELATVAAAVDSSWMAPVDSGLSHGTLSVSSAAAIASGLGSPSADVAADDLLDAAHELVELAARRRRKRWPSRPDRCGNGWMSHPLPISRSTVAPGVASRGTSCPTG